MTRFRRWVVGLAWIGGAGLMACSTSEQSSDAPGNADGTSSSGVGSGAGGSASTGATSTSTSTSTSATSSSSSGAGGAEPQPGTLTAGDWDDNLNWEFFRGYRTNFSALHDVSTVDVDSRVVVQVVNQLDEPVANAQVTIVDGEEVLLDAPTGADGRLLFFPQLDGVDAQSAIQVTVTPPPGQDGLEPITIEGPSGEEWVVEMSDANYINPTALDLAFVLDTTGSMADELAYIQAEIGGIVDDITEEFGQLSLRFGLVVYRDHGDAYVTRSFPFTDSLEEFQNNLNAQDAAGGGDIPEAMDEALMDMNDLQWRSGNVARVAFLVADASPHPGEEARAVLAESDLARRSGIKIYPIAASGIADDTEYYLRQSAQLTFGRYLFLTDDSGVGGSHAEPTIPCYQVQYLNVLMNRMLAAELTGTRVPADPGEVIRTVGNPNESGTCVLEGGQEVGF